MEIHTIKKQIIFVDDEDYKVISSGYNWYVDPCGYVARYEPMLNKKRTVTKLHRLIMNCPKGLVVDHIDGNKLDNRRVNLRICTQLENTRNCKKQKTKKLAKGVRITKHNRYQARITVEKIALFLGCFNTENEAAYAYNNAAIKNFGEFANLNIIQDER